MGFEAFPFYSKRRSPKLRPKKPPEGSGEIAAADLGCRGGSFDSRFFLGGIQTTAFFPR